MITEVNGHSPSEVKAAIEAARHETGKPTLICCKTIIGKGAPNKQGSESCHGAPLGGDEVAATRGAGLGPRAFRDTRDIYAGWNAREQGAAREQAWEQAMTAYAEAHPELAAELRRRLAGELPADFSEQAAAYIASASRRVKASPPARPPRTA